MSSNEKRTAAQKNRSTARKGGQRKVYRSVVPHKRPNIFIRLLQKLPSWSYWIGGGAIVAGYIWAFYFFFVSPTGFRWRALYGDVTYPEGYEIQGIDISHYQGKIDWDALKKAKINDCPVRFILIKATEGSSEVDENFADNFKQARDYDFIRGAYHFWSNQSDARSQAAWFLDKVNLQDGDLPPVLDVEYKPADVSLETFQQSILLWLHTVEDRYHVKPIIYTYRKFKEQYLNEEVFDQYPYWIAHYYVEKLEYKGEWKFWQYTDVGKLPGIDGNVDLDLYNGSFYDLRKLTIASGM